MSDRSGYGDQDTARFIPEPDKRPGRSPFQRDRARVLHSSALRRLAAKTQVVEVGQADFPRTRLTHSLECAQIGRELGAALGCDPDLVDAACLAHDLGHPPFGHNGEYALAQVARRLRRLRGQRAEPAAAHPAGGQGPRGWPQPDPGHAGRDAEVPAGSARRDGDASALQAKYGCYDEDAEIFDWIRDGAPPGQPCLEAQVMDWADDVAYSVHDLEDGLHSGLITLEKLQDQGERIAVVQAHAR